MFITPYSTAAYGTYSLSNGLLSTPNLFVGAAGTGIFTQSGGINQAGEITLGGATLPFSGAAVSTPATYNLCGGLLQSGYMNLYWSYGATAPTTFNFTAGTLQAASGGLAIALPITLGTAASNVATIDANGQAMTVNFDAYPSAGLLTGPGQLRVIDSVGGSTGGRPRRRRQPRQSPHQQLYRRYDGLVRHAPSIVSHGPARHGRFDRRRPRVGCVERPRGDTLRKRCWTSSRPGRRRARKLQLATQRLTFPAPQCPH